jgi:hypothetical protein
MLPNPNVVLNGPAGSLVIVTAGPESAQLWRFQVFAPHGGAGRAAQLAAAQILQGAARDSGAVQAIRGLYVNRWGHLPGAAPDALVARLQRDLSDGVMFAAYYIPSADFTRFATTERPDTSTLLADPAGAPIAWSPAQRIAAMLRRVPGHMPDALRGQVTALFTPQAIALFAVLLVGLAIAQFYGAGEALDAILVGFAWACAGFAGLLALQHFIGAIIDSARETTLPPIEADAKEAADALAVLGVSFLTALLLRARDQENIVSTEEPPPAEPLPVKKPPKVEKGWKDFPSKAKHEHAHEKHKHEHEKHEHEPKKHKHAAKVGKSTSKHYKETFFHAHPHLKGKVVVHHAVEQQVLTRYPGVFTESEMHSLENLRGIPNEANSEMHLSQIRRAWNQFYRKTPNPTQEQILEQATKIDNEFGSRFLPPVGD